MNIFAYFFFFWYFWCMFFFSFHLVFTFLTIFPIKFSSQLQTSWYILRTWYKPLSFKLKRIFVFLAIRLIRKSNLFSVKLNVLEGLSFIKTFWWNNIIIFNTFYIDLSQNYGWKLEQILVDNLLLITSF